MVQDEEAPTVTIVARTHLQVKHLISELKDGPATWRRRMTVLRSRKVTCLNDAIRESARPDTACKEACSDDTCTYRNRGSIQRLKAKLEGRCQSWDIEDLIQEARTQKACAYYTSQELANEAQLLLATHQHLANGCLDLTNTILVVDEAHRLGETVREGASGTIQLNTLQATATTIGLLVQPPASAVTVPMLDVERTSELAQQVAQLATWATKTAEEATQLPDRHWPPTPRSIDIEGWLGSVVGLEDPVAFSSGLVLLSSLITEQDSALVAIRRLIPPDQRSVIQDLARLVNEIRRLPVAYDITVLAAVKKPAVLLFTCIDASAMLAEQLQESFSCVVMTGTCNTPDRLAGDLGITFEHVLRTLHHVPPQQAEALTVTESLGQPVRLVAAEFNKPIVADWIGRMVSHAARVACNTHGAVAVYFPSQSSMNSVLERWSDSTAWPQPVWGSLVRSDMPDAYQALTEAVEKGPPFPVLCATARGRLAEGVDLKNQLCRVLILLGLPLKDSRHPTVASRVSFLESQGYKRKQQLQDEALVNVNQTIGRGLRSAQDYCVYVLCDERYASPSVSRGLTAVPHNGQPRIPRILDAADVGQQVARHLAHFVPEQPHSPGLLYSPDLL